MMIDDLSDIVLNGVVKEASIYLSMTVLIIQVHVLVNRSNHYTNKQFFYKILTTITKCNLLLTTV